MDISLLNKTVTFQKNEVKTDAIGNHINAWADHYICHATISGEGGGSESEAAGETVDHADICITVRWCAKTKCITTTGYRVLMDDDIYDITGIDHFSYRNKLLKFRCRKVGR